MSLQVIDIFVRLLQPKPFTCAAFPSGLKYGLAPRFGT
jgi:hypothetical protein